MSSRPWAARPRAGVLVLAVLVASSVVAVTFGTGYRVSRASQDDGSAWLSKGETVARVNGETGRADAEVVRDLARAGEPTGVVQTPDGGLWHVDRENNRITPIDSATGEPGAPIALEPGAGPGQLDVLSAAGRTWVVDRAGGTLTEYDAQLTREERRFEVAGGLDRAVIDSRGRVWVLTVSTGRLVRYDQAPGVPVEVADAGERGLDLTLAGDRPVVVRPAGGEVVGVEGGSAPVGVGAPVGDGRVVPAAPGAPEPVAFLAVEGAGVLLAVDLERRTVSRVPLGLAAGAELGAPVVAAERVYVPVFDPREVVVVDRTGLEVVDVIDEVPGDSDRFEVFLDDGRVWVNDPMSREAFVIARDGTTTPVDKGPGRGVDPPAAPVPAPRRPQAPVAVPRPVAPPAPVPVPAPARPGPAPGGGASSAPATPVAPLRVAVPDVVGDDYEDACREIEAVGLNCVAQPAGEGDGETDEVLSSDPRAGQLVPEGRTVTVLYVGPAVVPDDLVGQVPAEACAALNSQQPQVFRCEVRDLGVAPGDEPLDQVLSTEPPAGTEVDRGTRLLLDHYTQRRVPDLVGLASADARARLASSGLSHTDDPRSGAPKGQPLDQVTAQSVPAGQPAAAGTPVAITYYSDSNFTVPDVVGLPFEQACQQLEQHVTNACARQNVPGPSRNAGTTWGQSPPAGTVADAGTPVSVQYFDQEPQQLLRFRKANGDPVWSLRNAGDTGGLGDFEAAGDLAAFSYAKGLSLPEDRFVRLSSYRCTCYGLTNNRFYTTSLGGAAPGEFAAGYDGYTTWLFSQGYAGTVPLHRYVRTQGGTTAYAYSTSDATYAGSGFTRQATLGYVWAP